MGAHAFKFIKPMYKAIQIWAAGKKKGMSSSLEQCNSINRPIQTLQHLVYFYEQCKILFKNRSGLSSYFKIHKISTRTLAQF